MKSSKEQRTAGHWTWISACLSLVLFTVATSFAALSAAGAAPGDHWVGTWAAAVVPRLVEDAPVPAPFASQPLPAGQPRPEPMGNFSGQTLRQIVRSSIGGRRARVEFSNRFGTAPLAIGAANLALREKDASIVSGSGRALSFGGNPSVTIPAGAVVVSDPASLTIPARADLAIDLYLPGNTATSTLTMHRVASQTNYVSTPGNHAGEAAFPVAGTSLSWFLLSRVEVTTAGPMGAIVTFGDSITDGTRSTPDTNNRWPDHLVKRLTGKAGQPSFAVLNVGISGNRLLSEAAPLLGINALARFDADVLAQPGVRYVFVLEGINDIGMARENPAPAAADIITAHRQLIDRAHVRGLTIYGSTLLPFEGAAYFTPEGERKRQAVNEWLRTAHPYDALVDLEAAVRDPNHPTKFRPEFNSGDNLHPNDAGYEAMAKAIDLSLFKPASGR